MRPSINAWASATEVPAAWEIVTVAVPAITLTETSKLFAPVDTLLPSVSVTLVPSTLSSSSLPFIRPETVIVMDSTRSAASVRSMLAPLYTDTAAPFSVKVGFEAVASICGASLTATIDTVEAMASAVVSTPPSEVPPVSLTDVNVATRLAPRTSSLRFWYWRSLITAWASATEVPAA